MTENVLYPCHECGKTFDGLLDLTDHTLEHSNEKSYDCDLCGEFFTTKKELKKAQQDLAHAGASV